MKIWQEKNPETFTPPAHFGGLKVANIVPFADGAFSVQVSKAPPGAGGEMHHHDTWSQVFYILGGALTFDTGQSASRCTLARVSCSSRKIRIIRSMRATKRASAS